ncbi:MAG: hypothetical protein PWP70_1120, partial [Moorella sp. (in: firmicutes)]|nr:hypothetical protein [Moorella sp. (in: firmicutes)]
MPHITINTTILLGGGGGYILPTLSEIAIPPWPLLK